jgi:hypothetical protein
MNIAYFNRYLALIVSDEGYDCGFYFYLTKG